MAANSDPNAGKNKPIVVKKIKKGGGGHHGGSWKVAYADFVTAMMAFFLLMWLLGSVDQDKREDVGSYFKRPLKAVLSAGPHQGGDRIVAASQGSPRPGVLAGNGAGAAAEEKAYEQFKQRIVQEIAENSIFEVYKDLIQLDKVQDGMRLTILDKYDEPMFATGSADMNIHARRLLRELAPIIDALPNRLVISGHTDATRFVRGSAGYSNWELSADRANAARRELVLGGLSDTKVLCIEGLGSTAPAADAPPTAASNRRISLLLLNARAEDSYLRENS